MRASLLVAAGGSGTRFSKSFNAHSGIRKNAKLSSKVFIPLQDKPLIAHSLKVFQAFPPIVETIIAVPKESLKQARELLAGAGLKNLRLVSGGKTRAESVYRALKKSDLRNPWVLIHDAARPFVTKEDLESLFDSARSANAVILGKKIVPTIKEAGADGVIRRTVDRSFLYEAETPQLIRRDILERAYRENPKAMEATDEASLLEVIQEQVKIVTHEGWNPKITSYRDFELAEAFLNRGSFGKTGGITRTGIGKDIHRLVAGRKLMIGGVPIPFAKGSLGHSDGDALLHAIADAILGAAGLGDIGEWFPDHDSRYKNIPSSKIMESIVAEVKKRGWIVEHADTIIVLEKPKLGEYKKRIRANVARLLDIREEEAVSIKAKTMEGLGPEGEGHAVSAEAIVTLRRGNSS